MSFNSTHGRLPLFLFLAIISISLPLVSAGAESFNAMFRERLTQWITFLQEEATDHEAGIETSDAIAREADKYLKRRDVKTNFKLSVPFSKAKLSAERSSRKHKRALQKIRAHLRKLKGMQSYLMVETLSPDQGVILDFRGPVNIQNDGQPVEPPAGADAPLVISPGDLLEIGEDGRVTFLHPGTGAEISVFENTKARLVRATAEAEAYWLLLKGKFQYRTNKKFNAFRRNIITPLEQILERHQRFQITSNSGVAVAERGTAFTFEYDSGGRTTVILWEGTLNLTPWDKADEITLTAPARVVVGPDRRIEGPVPLTPEELERILADDADG